MAWTGNQDIVGSELVPLGSGMLAKTPTIKERLDNAIKQAEERLKVAKRARELFDRNPDLEELVDLMQKGHF